MLHGLRVLDLTDAKAHLCGKILADLGADVVKIEPVPYDPARDSGPFYEDRPHPERSITWFALNQNKRGITLDIGSADGKPLFQKLVAGARFVIESFAPGHMDGLGLGYEALRQINPALVMISITPFGQAGPYRDLKATDIELMALGGMVHLTGDPDRPPVRLSYPISYHATSAYAANAGLVAHLHRNQTGQGQHVDVAIQQCVNFFLSLSVRESYEMQGTVMQRKGQFRERWAGCQRMLWPCRDGAVAFQVIGGATGRRSNKALAQWIQDEGMADEFLANFDWDGYGWGAATQEDTDKIEVPIARFFMNHGKQELYQGARERRIILAPVSTASDLVENEQLRARHYWVNVPHPELGKTLTYPGSFIRSSLKSSVVARRAPLIGEHNEEVLGEIGVSKDGLVLLKQAGVI